MEHFNSNIYESFRKQNQNLKHEFELPIQKNKTGREQTIADAETMKRMR